MIFVDWLFFGGENLRLLFRSNGPSLARPASIPGGALYPDYIAEPVDLSAFMVRRRLAGNGRSLHKRRNKAMGVDRSTLRAFLWLSASASPAGRRRGALAGAEALHLLPRGRPLAASCALMRKATETLDLQYSLDRALNHSKAVSNSRVGWLKEVQSISSGVVL